MEIEPTLRHQEISSLPFGEHVALWGIRIWAQNFRTGDKSKNLLVRGLSLAGVSGAYYSLDDLMMLIACSAQRSVEINCTTCTNLSIDEHFMLDGIAFWMEETSLGPPQFATFDFLPLAAARVAEGHFRKMADIFKTSGHWIRRRYLVKPRNPLTKRPTISLQNSTSIH